MIIPKIVVISPRVDRFQALRVFSQVVESGSFSGPPRSSGFDYGRLAPRRGARGASPDAPAEPHHPARQPHRERPGVLRARGAAPRRPRGGRAGGEPRRGRAARHDQAHDFGEFRRAPCGTGDRRISSPRTPEVRFDVSLSDRIVDLVEEGFDLAVRIGAPGSDNIVARKLGETRLVPCASPAYLAAHGAPQVPEDLARHNCFTYEYVAPRNVWRFRDAAGAERAVRVGGSLHCEQRRPACRGRGAAARASCSSRRSSSGPKCAPGAWCRCCRSSCRRRCRSTRSIRAASTCRRRCGCSSTS